MADGENGKIYAKLDDHDRRITTLESTRPYLQDLIDRSIKSNELLTKTMQDVQMSMVKLNDKMDRQADEMDKMQKSFDAANAKTNEKLNAVENKVTALEDAGKFDIRAFVKRNWPWLCVIIGMGALYVSQFVKF